MHSILVTTDFLSAPGAAALGEAEAHHLRDVLRARAGDEVRLLDGRGAARAARVARQKETGAE